MVDKNYLIQFLNMLTNNKMTKQINQNKWQNKSKEVIWVNNYYTQDQFSDN